MDSLLKAILFIEDKYEVYTYICFNGTTDNSKDLVELWLKKHKDFICEVLYLDIGNLVEAQRAVMKKVEQSFDFFGFFDADIIFKKNTIQELIDELELDSRLVVVYSCSKPVSRKHKTLTEKVVNLYDAGPSIYSERKYLHGRAFLTKDWYIPKTDPPLLVDDIYLSFYYLTKYGADSVKKAQDSIVEFRQIRSFKDYYKVYRRRNVEVKKCLTIFPEFKNIPKEQIDRKIIWKNFWKASVYDKFLWFILFLYKAISKKLLIFENFWSPVNREQWEVSVTSKRTNVNPVIVLIEGLDCSGKKTLARSISKAFLVKGVSSEINYGPLGPGWYRKLSQIVSLNNLPDFIRSFVYSLEIVIGSKKANLATAEVVLQISSPLRSSAYSYVANKRIRLLLFKLFLKRIPSYDYSVYLTTDYSTRISRHRMQVAAGENSDNINKRFKTKYFFELLEVRLLELMKKNIGKYKVFITTDKNAEEIGREVVQDINNLLKYKI